MTGLELPNFTGSLIMGMDARSITFGGVVLGLQLSVIWPFNEYAYINPNKGLAPSDQRRGLMLEFSTFLGIGSRKKGDELKLLRDKKWFTFD